MDVAFGVVGVVALAIELVDSINKLGEFIESFKDVSSLWKFKSCVPI